MRKIAIVGAGLSGLALCIHLQMSGAEAEITLFDANGVGAGASGVASGLLHPFLGRFAPLAWMGREGMAATLELLNLVGEGCCDKTGILRLALSSEQREAFAERAKEEGDIEWREEVQMAGIRPLPGIFIRSGVTVHMGSYLRGLWGECKARGATLEKRKVALEKLEGFDQVVLAAGGGMEKFNLGLKLNYNKGQALICKKPKYFKPMCSVIGKGYFAHMGDEERCTLGSTYERESFSKEPCLGVATEYILPRADEYLSDLRSFEVLGCKAEVRVTGPRNDRPVCEEVRPGVFALTGMGSRGLLYHSYFGEKLAHMMNTKVLAGAV